MPVFRRDHQLAQFATVSWADVTEHRLIGVSSESGNRLVLDNALAQNSIQIRWAYEVFVRASFHVILAAQPVARCLTVPNVGSLAGLA